VPCERRLPRCTQPVLDGANGQRLGAEQVAPGADRRVRLAFHEDRLQAITNICICKYQISDIFATAIIAIAGSRRTAMSVKEISRAALSEGLLSRSPPVVIEALDRKYYDSGHIPTARMLPLAETDRSLRSSPTRSRPSWSIAQALPAKTRTRRRPAWKRR